MSKKFAVVFPGQGSQAVGMLADLAKDHTVDLWSLSQEGPKEQLNETQNTQPALLCAGIAVMRVLDERLEQQPLAMAGHSLGEYTALVAAGVLDLTDAARLVAKRGRLMQEAVPVGHGAMAAILGLDDKHVRDLCEEAAQGQVVEAVNFNSPGQVVVAGDVAAVSRAIEVARAVGEARAAVGCQRPFPLCADEASRAATCSSAASRGVPCAQHPGAAERHRC